MTQENPTSHELDAILQVQNGDYEVETPAWWPVQPEAKDALDRQLCAHYKLVTPDAD